MPRPGGKLSMLSLWATAKQLLETTTAFQLVLLMTQLCDLLVESVAEKPNTSAPHRYTMCVRQRHIHVRPSIVLYGETKPSPAPA